MIAPKHDSRPPGRKRYPGARPFSDSPEDRQIFFGRDADIDRLFERVLGARLLVLFSKSGLGKTSLLMAGVFPRLREKLFLPVPIRLNRRGSPVEIVVEAMTEACKSAGADLTAGEAGGLWEFLCTSLVWKDDLLLTPVLVFDQFEEIFTLQDADFRISLAAELGALASGTPPERLHTSERRGADRGAQLGAQPPEVKILLSLREEYLGTLQELSGAIPGLFQERVRLAPLGENEARAAICKPAARREEPGDLPFDTPPFEYEDDALVEMLAFLRGKSQIIEPFQLQLLCCRAEEIVAARAREANAERAVAQRAEGLEHSLTVESGQGPTPIRITRGELGGPAGMELVLRQFYRRVVDMLGWRDRGRARRLCEEGLLSATGSRLMLDQAQIGSDYGMSAAALATLVEERLLRREQRLESLFYEISHDRLAESINRNRPWRIPKRLRHTLKGAALVLLLTIVAVFWWIRQIEQARVTANRARVDAEEARVTADHARADSEELVAFLIGESLLEKLRPVGRNEILKEVQGKVQAYLDHAPDDGKRSQLRTRGLALRNEGDILKSRGNLGEAIAKFRDSAAVFEHVAATPKSPDPKAERARSLYRLGDGVLEQGKISEALKTHREALALRQMLYDGGDYDVETTMDLADSNSSVGMMLNHMGQPRQALVHLELARNLIRPIEASMSRSPRVLKALHEAIDNRAESLELSGDLPGSRTAYTDAQKIVEKWVQAHPLSADARFRQIIAVSRLANEQMGHGAVENALKQYSQINRSADELIRWDDTNAEWRRDFVATLILNAGGLVAVRKYEDALKAYGKALKDLESMAETDQSRMSLKKDLSWLYRARGQLAVARKDWKRATEDFTASERYIAEAARADPAFATWQREWAWVLFDLANAWRGAGEPVAASASLRRGRDIISVLIKTAPEATVLHGDLVTFFEEEIRVLEDSGKTKEAAALAREKERTVTSALAAWPSDIILLNQAYLTQVRIGNAAKSVGRLDDALAAYRKGLEKIRRVAELEPNDVTSWDNLGEAHKRIGDAFYRGKRWADAQGAYRNGLAPAEKASAIAPQRADLVSRVFLLRLAIGDTLEAEGKHESALAEFERARERIDKAIALDGKVADYFDNRRALYVRVAQIKAALEDVDGAQKAYSAGAEAGSRAVDLADSADKKAEFANDVYLLHVKAGDWYSDRKDGKVALQNYDGARPWIDKAILAAPGQSIYFSNLGELHLRIGKTKRALGDVGSVEPTFHASIEAFERSASLAAAKRDAAQQAEHANSLHRAHEAFAEFFESRNDKAGALAAHGRALAALKRAAGLDSKDAAYPDAMRLVYKKTARLKEDLGDVAGAEADLRTGAEAGQRAAELGKSALYLNLAALALFDLGNFYEESPDKALLAYSGAAEKVQLATRLDANNALYHRGSSVVRRMIGEVRVKFGDAAKARDDFDAAVSAGRRATELGPNDGENWRALYLAQLFLATNIIKQGDVLEARFLIQDALKTAEQAARLLPQDRTISDDITTLEDLVANRSR